MNTTLLRQRYGLPATRTTVVRAIQNNNYYYDMLSRKNVIGGF
jgi:hypothetical protein